MAAGRIKDSQSQAPFFFFFLIQFLNTKIGEAEARNPRNCLQSPAFPSCLKVVFAVLHIMKVWIPLFPLECPTHRSWKPDRKLSLTCLLLSLIEPPPSKNMVENEENQGCELQFICVFSGVIFSQKKNFLPIPGSFAHCLKQ